jgi:hypothetical protein
MGEIYKTPPEKKFGGYRAVSRCPMIIFVSLGQGGVYSVGTFSAFISLGG